MVLVYIYCCLALQVELSSLSTSSNTNNNKHSTLFYSLLFCIIHSYTFFLIILLIYSIF